MDYNTPGQYVRNDPSSLSVQPYSNAQPQQQQAPALHEPVDPRRHPSVYKDKAGAAARPGSHAQGQNGWPVRHGQQADHYGSAHAGQQSQLQAHAALIAASAQVDDCSRRLAVLCFVLAECVGLQANFA